jgi:predicted ATPase
MLLVNARLTLPDANFGFVVLLCQWAGVLLTLRATLDWSYQLLSEAERELLRRIAIFAGPFSLDAACALAAVGASNAEIADGIADLVGKSLVIRVADSVTAEFRLLETTRVYALDIREIHGGIRHRRPAPRAKPDRGSRIDSATGVSTNLRADPRFNALLHRHRGSWPSGLSSRQRR